MHEANLQDFFSQTFEEFPRFFLPLEGFEILIYLRTVDSIRPFDVLK